MNAERRTIEELIDELKIVRASTIRMFESFDDRMLLIVDEAHQCLYSKGEARGARTIEFIRELFDARKCGVIICGT